MDAVTEVHNARAPHSARHVERRAGLRLSLRHWPWHHLTRALRGGVLGLGTVGLLACGSDAAGPTPPTAQALFFSFAFQWPAVNLALTAPYDTAQLVAIPRTATGAVLTDTNGAPAVVHYTTTDSAVQVSATGLVTAHSVTAGARILARLTIGGITRTDTALVQVTNTPFPAPLATLSIHPNPNIDEGGLVAAVGNINSFFSSVPYFATIATGNPATDTICFGIYGCNYPFLVYYASSDPTIATIDQSGTFLAQGVGHVIFTVSTIAYGVRKVDSLPFVIGYQQQGQAYIQIDSSKHPPTPYVPTNATRQHSLYSVGLALVIVNYTEEEFTVSGPMPAHGVAFGHNPDGSGVVLDPALTTVDTLTTVAINPHKNGIYVRFDSAGTYTLTYHGLQSGTTLSDTYVVRPYP